MTKDFGKYAKQMADTVIKNRPYLAQSWHYEFGLMLKAMEAVWRNTGDKAYFEYIKKNLDYFIGDDGSIKTYTINEYNLDQVNTGKAVLMMYKETKEEKYKIAADTLRKQLSGHPRTAEGGFWHKQIYPQQMWLDGVYMADPFYAEYAATFNETEDFADVVKQFTLLFEKARDPQTGLLYHAWNATKDQAWADPQTGCSPNVWGRALGWYAMALVDALDFIEGDANRAPLLEIAVKLAETLEKYQDKSSKLWYQVVDKGDQAGNYLESSGSGMFVYMLAKAAKKGYVDMKYLQIAEDGFNGMKKEFVSIDADGSMHLNRICNMAGLGKYKEDMEFRSGTFEYYIKEPIVSDDYKGLGPFILAGMELEK